MSQGESAVLECEADGNPITKDLVKWKRSGFSMDTRTSTVHDRSRGVLTVTNVTIKDTGVFQCVANNGVGEPATQDVEMIVKCKFTNKGQPKANCNGQCTTRTIAHFTYSFLVSLFCKAIEQAWMGYHLKDSDINFL